MPDYDSQIKLDDFIRNSRLIQMNSFNITTVLLKNMTTDYPFVIYALELLKTLLQSRDYIKTQKSLL